MDWNIKSICVTYGETALLMYCYPDLKMEEGYAFDISKDAPEFNMWAGLIVAALEECQVRRYEITRKGVLFSLISAGQVHVNFRRLYDKIIQCGYEVK